MLWNCIIIIMEFWLNRGMWGIIVAVQSIDPIPHRGIIVVTDAFTHLGIRPVLWKPWPRLNIKTIFPMNWDSHVKIRQLRDHLTFNMGIPILVRWQLFILRHTHTLSLWINLRESCFSYVCHFRIWTLFPSLDKCNTRPKRVKWALLLKAWKLCDKWNQHYGWLLLPWC